MKKKRILIADDDFIFCELTKYILTENKYNVTLCNDSESTIAFLDKDCCDLVLLDLHFPDYQTGLTTLKSIKERDRNIPVIVVTSENISLMNRFPDLIQNGAQDIIEKPIQEERLLLTVHNALSQKNPLDKSHLANHELIYLIGISPKIQEVKAMIKDELQTDQHLIIYGDPGTGVDNIAKQIHYNSSRTAHNFFSIDCSKMTNKEMHNALFGDSDELDAVNRFNNLTIVQAEKSTMLISNIDLMPIKLQEKFVRTLYGRKLNILGGESLAGIDVRLLFTAKSENHNRHYTSNISSLLHNICPDQLIIPSLNDRREDIPLIINHLISKYNQTTDSSVSINSSALKLLMKHKWVKNITELKKVILRTLHQIDGEEITSEDISFQEDTFDSFIPLPYKQAVKNFEKRYLEQIMEYKDWNLNDAAQVLNIDRSNLFKKLQKHGIKIKSK